MDNDKAIKALNTLLEINNDRIEGYEKASKETNEQDLKVLFDRFGYTSQQCKNELITEVTRLGGEPEEGTRTSGKFFRTWMDVKAAITGKDRKAILSSCEFGEDQAVETYENVLKDYSEDLSSNQINMIESQLEKIRDDHNEVRAMRDELLTV
jgi:uncharacterized protein (TIGR02284 family)